MADIAQLEPVRLTGKGLRLLAKVQAGAAMEFTRAVIGDGFLPDGQDVAGLIGIISEVASHQTGTTAASATVDITRVVQSEGTVTLRVKIKNGDTAFYLRELGIMASDPDEGEILYAYINFGDSAGAMPVFDGSTYVTRNISLTFIVSNAATVTANVTLPAEVSYEEFEAHTGNKQNPHGVTAAQVGLGNVEARLNDICNGIAETVGADTFTAASYENFSAINTATEDGGAWIKFTNTSTGSISTLQNVDYYFYVTTRDVAPGETVLLHVPTYDGSMDRDTRFDSNIILSWRED